MKYGNIFSRNLTRKFIYIQRMCTYKTYRTIGVLGNCLSEFHFNHCSLEYLTENIFWKIHSNWFEVAMKSYRLWKI